MPSFTENESIGPGLGSNLRPFARTDLSGSVRGKPGGMVTTKLSALAEIVFKAVWREGPSSLLSLDALASVRN